MGRRKEVKLNLTDGKGMFLTSGTEIVEKLPFMQAGLNIVGDGFKIHITLLKTPIKGEFVVDTVIEYEEEIKEWR